MYVFVDRIEFQQLDLKRNGDNAKGSCRKMTRLKMTKTFGKITIIKILTPNLKALKTASSENHGCGSVLIIEAMTSFSFF